MALFPHGGQVYAAASRLGIPPEKILDFSACINPLGPPPAATAAARRALRRIASYPDPFATELVSALSRHLGFPPDCFLVGNGSTELIHLIARLASSGRAGIFVPTFSEYERAIRLSGGRPALLDSFSVRSLLSRDLLFLCNPNNPTGRLLPKREVLKIAERCGGILVVDEAFIDFEPAESVIAEAADWSARRRVVVLRSFTKFYALTGLRVGYLVAAPQFVSLLRKRQEPWSVNIAAQAAAAAALGDKPYEERTRRLIMVERGKLERDLSDLGFFPIPSAANFLLVKAPAPLLTPDRLRRAVERLAAEGILIRNAADFLPLPTGHFRLAVRTGRENRVMLAALSRAIRYL